MAVGVGEGEGEGEKDTLAQPLGTKETVESMEGVGGGGAVNEGVLHWVPGSVGVTEAHRVALPLGELDTEMVWVLDFEWEREWVLVGERVGEEEKDLVRDTLCVPDTQ